jgi:hypothetical protein
MRLAPARADIAEYVQQLEAIMAGGDEVPVELDDVPFPPGQQEEPRAPQASAPAVPPPDRPEQGSVLSHVNQWAADLLRRRLPNR